MLASIRTSLALLALASAWSPIAAHAQDSAPPAPAASPSPEPELVLEVTANKRKPVELAAPASHTEIPRDAITALPGGTEAELPRLLAETIPSAVSGAQDRIFFRQNEFGLRFEVDGILLPPQPSNSLAAPFSPRYIEQLDAIEGALPAEFGQGTQSLVLITTRGARANATAGTGADAELAYGAYNSFWPEASVWGRGADFRYFLGAAYWSTDRGLGTPDPVSNTDQTQGGNNPVHDGAHGDDELLKMDWDVGGMNQLSLIVSNRMSFYQIPNFPSGFRPTDPLFTTGDSFGNGPLNYAPASTNDTQAETSDFVEAVWRHTLGPERDAWLQLGVFYTYYLVDVDNDPANDLAALTLVPASANPNPSSFAEDRHVNAVGAQLDAQAPLGPPANVVKGGLLAQLSQASGSLSVTEQDPNDASSLLTATDASLETGLALSAYLQDELRLGTRIKLEAGLRFDDIQYRYADSQPSYDQFEPRLGVSWLVAPETKLHAYYGRLFLPAPVEDLHDVFNTLQAGQLGSYDIKPEKDNYYEVGLEQGLPANQTGKLTVYYKDATDLLDDAQLLNTSLSQQFNWAHGYAYGVEATVRGRLGDRWSDFVNYAYGIAKGEGLDGGLFVFPKGQEPGSSYQLLDHVQKHTVTAGVTYAVDNRWATVQALFGSGLPTGPNNTVTLPSHFSFDLSAGYRFTGPEWYSGFRVGADLLNILNNVYPISVANGFNGSYYAPGRELIVRVGKEI